MFVSSFWFKQALLDLFLRNAFSGQIGGNHALLCSLPSTSPSSQKCFHQRGPPTQLVNSFRPFTSVLRGVQWRLNTKTLRLGCVAVPLGIPRLTKNDNSVIASHRSSSRRPRADRPQIQLPCSSPVSLAEIKKMIC